jgi:Tfp pilus assembly protein PilF
MGRDDEAASSCRELLKVNPLLTSAYIILAEISQKKKDLAGAIANCRKAVEIEPRNVLLKMKYAGLLILEKDFSTAMKTYNELLGNGDVMRDSGLIFKIALFNAKYGTLNKAEELLARAFQIKPNGNILFNYALVLSKNNKMEEAVKQMQLALSQYSVELSEDQRRLAQQAIEMWKEKK